MNETKFVTNETKFMTNETKFMTTQPLRQRDKPQFRDNQGNPMTTTPLRQRDKPQFHDNQRKPMTTTTTTRETDPDLFPEGDELPHRLAPRVHDLRGLFVTASLTQGRSDTWVRERTLHKTVSMLDHYRAKVARNQAKPFSGERGIRTLGTLASSHDFQFGEGCTDGVETAENADNREGDDDLCGPLDGPLPHSAAVSDPVEAALAAALEGATAAKEWALVGQLAKELEARRLARAHVVSLDDARAAGRGR